MNSAGLSMSFSEISLKMNKFNLKFNKHLARLERWHRITAMLSDYESVVVSSYKFVSPEEYHCLKEIQLNEVFSKSGKSRGVKFTAEYLREEK